MQCPRLMLPMGPLYRESVPAHREGCGNVRTTGLLVDRASRDSRALSADTCTEMRPICLPEPDRMCFGKMVYMHACVVCCILNGLHVWYVCIRSVAHREQEYERLCICVCLNVFECTGGDQLAC